MGSRAYIARNLFVGLSPHYLETTPERVASSRRLNEHDQLAAYFNLDFGGGRIRGIYLMKDERLRPIFSAWLAPFADMGAAHVSMEAPLGSDHFAFREHGIAAFPFIQEETPWVHHSNMDTFDQLSENQLKQSAAIVAAVAYLAATRPKQLPRPPQQLFR